MKQTIIPMKMDAKVVISVRDDLYLEGVPQAQFTSVVDIADSFRMKEDNGIFYVRSESECKILLPETASVTIEKVDGDANVRNMKNRVIVGKIGGDFSLQTTPAASIESVGGDCALRNVGGMVEIARVGGDLDIEQASQMLVSTVGGDLSAEKVTGKVETKVGGDVKLSLTDPNVSPVKISAGGDIEIVVPKGANAKLDFKAGGDISIQTSDNQAEFERFAKDIILGLGGSTIELTAGGDISISDTEPIKFEFDNVFNQFDMDWDRISSDIEKKITEGLRVASRSSEYAARQAERAGRNAQASIDRVVEKLEEKGIFRHGPGSSAGFIFEKPAPPEPAAKPKVSEDERMLILKMLSEKKITVEEAEKLLKALEGQP